MEKFREIGGVVLLFALLIAVKCYLVFYAVGVTGPTCFGDELVYKEDAGLLFSGQLFTDIHYPPLYSLALSPAFLSGDRWYEWMLFINVLAASAIVFPVWLISRSLLPRPLSFVPVALSALLPVHVVYPQMIMSENLFLPLFLFAFYFAFVRPRSVRFSGCLLGAACALAYMTKYLFLPAIPILFAVWWFVDRKKKPQLSDVATAAASFFAVYVLWLAYAHLSGIGILNALGYRVAFGSESAKSVVPSVAGIAMWAAAYCSYFILAIAPAAGLFSLLVYNAIRKKTDVSAKEKMFLGAVVVLTVAYLAVSVQHSARASYNQPTPSYLLGRYLMQLTPLFLIAAVLAAYKLWKTRSSISPYAALAALIFAVLLVYSAHGTLYGQTVWKFPAWFAASTFNSIDTMVYRSNVVFYGALSVVFIIAALLFSSRFLRPKQRRYTLLLILLALLGFQLVACYKGYTQMAAQEPWPIHGRILAEFFKNDMEQGVSSIGLVNGASGVSAEQLALSLEFWGVPKSTVTVIPLGGNMAEISGASRQYFLTGSRLGAQEALAYYVGGKRFYLYYYTDARKMQAPSACATPPSPSPS